MIKKTFEYVDLNGNEIKEEHLFRLTEAELTEANLRRNGEDLASIIQRIVDTRDGNKITTAMKDLILKSYGQKSEDGKRFIKSEALSEAFSQTEPYNMLFMELCTDAEAAAQFVNGIMPAKFMQKS